MKKRIYKPRTNCNEAQAGIGRAYREALTPLKKDYQQLVQVVLEKLRGQIEAGYCTDLGDEFTWANHDSFVPERAVMLTGGDPDPTGDNRLCLKPGIALLDDEVLAILPPDDDLFAAILALSPNVSDADGCSDDHRAADCLAADVREAYRKGAGPRRAARSTDGEVG